MKKVSKRPEVYNTGTIVKRFDRIYDLHQLASNSRLRSEILSIIISNWRNTVILAFHRVRIRWITGFLLIDWKLTRVEKKKSTEEKKFAPVTKFFCCHAYSTALIRHILTASEPRRKKSR